MSVYPTGVVTTRPADEYGPAMLVVETHWHGQNLDRPNTGGTAVKDQRMADRLVRAINSGAAYSNPKVVRDVSGQTYVHADRAFMGKYLNADLRKLGY